MKQRHRWLAGVLVAVALAALMLIAPGEDGALAQGDTIYVDTDATTGGNNGSSWADAFIELQPALEAAGTGDEIWVAAGTYKPTAEHGGTGDRYRSFQLLKGVALYGGFDPDAGDIAWEDRDWVAHPTILSGDLDGDDGPDFANNDENSYHVFYHSGGGLDGSAILDGFTVTGGNGNGEWPQNVGGGMYNYYASPALSNCTFEGNSAGGGGGILNQNSSPVLTNCSFLKNNGHGGGMHNYQSSPELINCAFSNNTGTGAGMVNYTASSPTLVNCTFSGNSAGLSGGAMFNTDSSSPALTNCTFLGNSAGVSGGGIYNELGSSPALTNCILWDDIPDEIYNDDTTSSPFVTYSNVEAGYPGEGNIDAHPRFVDPDRGDFHLHPCSPCIDAGDNDAPDLPLYDFEGDDRILDGDGIGMAIVDMGVDEVAVVGTCFRIHLPVVLRGY